MKIISSSFVYYFTDSGGKYELKVPDNRNLIYIKKIIWPAKYSFTRRIVCNKIIWWPEDSLKFSDVCMKKFDRIINFIAFT